VCAALAACAPGEPVCVSLAAYLLDVGVHCGSERVERHRVHRASLKSTFFNTMEQT
jgi:hypothetical protein